MGLPQRFGRYESLRVIASGGMATVYLARNVGEGGFERLVAVKVMHPHIAADESFHAMFLDEARLAARIRHPNVVGVIDVQKTPDGMFLVMEYVDGPSLHQLRRSFRKRGTTLPIGVTLRIFVDAMSGLHDAHELVDNDGRPLHLVHRDVSPQNILVGKDGVSRITDFGVARANSRITSTRGGALKGKIAYMPPEQVQNLRLDRRSDVYAAGCALWEALTGVRLFRADSEAAIIHMIMQGAVQRAAHLNEDVPPAVDRVVMRALSVDRNARQPSAALLADELEIAARDSGIEIATHRQVATFIKELPESRVEPRPELPSSPSARTSLSGIEQIPPLGEDGALVPRDPYLTPSEVFAGTSGTTTRGLTASPTQPQRRGSNVSMWLGVAVAAIITGAGGAILWQRASAGPTAGSPTGETAGASAAATQSAPPAAPSFLPPVGPTTAPATTEEQDESEEVAAPKTRQPAEPSAQPEVADKPADDRKAATPAPRSGKKAKQGAAKTSNTTGRPGYIPPEL